MKSAGAAWWAFMAGLSGDGTDGTGQDGLAEQAGGHLGEHDGAAAALVEERVQLDDVGRHHAAAVVQQLQDRKRVVSGKSVSRRVELGGCRIIQQKKASRRREDQTSVEQ